MKKLLLGSLVVVFFFFIAATHTSAQEGNKINSKYDFIPGEEIIFFDDFSQAEIGDFPYGWNTNASGEIVTTNIQPGKWLRFSTATTQTAIWTDELLNLPENYTIEFDIIPIEWDQGTDYNGPDYVGYSFRLMKSINKDSYDWGMPGEGGFLLSYNYGNPNYRSYINDYNGELYDINGSYEKEGVTQKKDNKYHIAIWVQKARVRVYQDETKIFDVIKAFPKQPFKIDRIRFELGSALVSNIRIATGLPDMRNKLLNEGKLVSYGVYFDVNKDVVKTESFATLKEIAQVLKDNPKVKIKIVGHTDSDGDDKSNLDLSKRRAASVKNYLVKNFSIDGTRIETDGKGESDPIANNDSSVNKAKNRRVEFIKL